MTLTRQYDAYGNLLAGGTTSGYAFTGREWDPETGLYYYRARYYDPRLGRFVSEDPIRLSGGLNFFAYVSNNPILRTDPLGLSDNTVGPGKFWPRGTGGKGPGKLIPFPEPEPPIPTPGDAMKAAAKGVATAAAVVVTVVAWTCVSIEAYCASQSMDFCECMRAAALPWDCPGCSQPVAKACPK